jgi:hypothetical protein
MELKEITLLIVGALLGVISTFVLFVLQFRASIAFRRVERVAQATNEILALVGRSAALRDIHRYSLGVVIDKLRSFNGNGPPWPCLIELNSKDRWDLYNNYVRTVVEEITPYAFLGRWLPRSAWLRLSQVYALSRLCDQLETISGLLDGAVEEGAIEINKELVTPKNELYGDTLKAAYRKLYDRWEIWKQIARTT